MNGVLGCVLGRWTEFDVDHEQAATLSADSQGSLLHLQRIMTPFQAKFNALPEKKHSTCCCSFLSDENEEAQNMKAHSTLCLVHG